jgi:hypothetical protein
LGLFSGLPKQGSNRRWVVRFTSWSQYPWRKSLWYPSCRRLGGHQMLWRREKSLAPCQKLNPESSAIHPIIHCYINDLSCIYSEYTVNMM